MCCCFFFLSLCCAILLPFCLCAQKRSSQVFAFRMDHYQFLSLLKDNIGATVGFIGEQAKQSLHFQGVVISDHRGVYVALNTGETLAPTEGQRFSSFEILTPKPAATPSPPPTNPGIDDATLQRKQVYDSVAALNAASSVEASNAKAQREMLLEESRRAQSEAHQERGVLRAEIAKNAADNAAQQQQLRSELSSIYASQGTLSQSMSEIRAMMGDIAAAVGTLKSISPAAPSVDAAPFFAPAPFLAPAPSLAPAPFPNVFDTSAAQNASIADLTAEMRRQRGCLETAATSDISPEVFKQSPVSYQWRSDDESAPQLRVALRKLAAYFATIARIGTQSFAAELRGRMEIKNTTAHIVELGLIQMLPNAQLQVALGELAVSISSPEGKHERELLVLARATPPPTSKHEAEHWRSGAQIPTEPVASKLSPSTARATQPRNNAGNNHKGRNNNDNKSPRQQQNNQQRQGGQASKN